MRNTTIRQALQHVADNPVMETDEMLVVPAHELVARTLYEIANSPMTGRTRDASRANVARGMIFNRLVGKRQPGSHPATKQQSAVAFRTLTGEVEQ
jgi:hypothetical protein